MDINTKLQITAFILLGISIFFLFLTLLEKQKKN